MWAAICIVLFVTFILTVLSALGAGEFKRRIR